MSEWRETTIEDISVYVNRGVSPKYDEENGITVINQKCIRNGKLEFSLARLHNTEKKFANEKLLLKNDILINSTGVGTAGRVGLFYEEFDAIVDSHVSILRLNTKSAYPKFIFYNLRRREKELEETAEGSTGQIELKRDGIKSLEVKLPPLKEQKAIAEVLSSLDDKIDLLHRQNKTLEELAQTLFRQWFIEEADNEWEDGTLGDVIDIFDSKRIPLSKMQRDKLKDGTLYPYYGAAKIMDYINDYIFDGEYILMGEDGTVRTDDGYPILQYATGKFWVNNHTHVLQAKEPYSNYFIWSYLLEKNIDEIVTGAVQPKINQTNLKSLDFPKYPLDLIEQFNEQANIYLEKINQNKMQIKTLENMRDTLLPKLMNGEVRLKI